MEKDNSHGARTVAPPVDAPSVDLDELFGNMTIAPDPIRVPTKRSSSTVHSKSMKSSTSKFSAPSSSAPRSQSLVPEKATSSTNQHNESFGTILEDSPSSSRSSYTPSSIRAQSEYSSIGNMQRTFMEGLVPKTGYVPDIQPSAIPSTIGKSQYTQIPETQTIIASRAPPGVKSLLLDAKDLHMASLQPLYNSMRGEERKEQEKWAQSTIQKMSICPEGNHWKRRDDGYQCKGTTHFIDDDLLAEGKGGMYLLYYPRDMAYRCGLYYPDPDQKTQFLYAGPKPRQPPWAADYLDAKGAGYHDAGGKKSEENLRLTPSIVASCSDKDLEILILMLKMGNVSPEEGREMLLSECKKGVEGSSPEKSPSSFGAGEKKTTQSVVPQSSHRPLSPSSQLTHVRIATTPAPSSSPSRQPESSSSLKSSKSTHVHTISHLDSPPLSQSSIRPTTGTDSWRPSSSRPTQSASPSSFYPSSPSALPTRSRASVRPSSQSTLKPSSRSTVRPSAASTLPTVSQLPFSRSPSTTTERLPTSASKRPTSKIPEKKEDA